MKWDEVEGRPNIATRQSLESLQREVRSLKMFVAGGFVVIGLALGVVLGLMFT